MWEKLADYSLNTTHIVGGPKARGFALILGITIEDIGYLTSAIETGILNIAISAVRDNAPYGHMCEVPIPIHGLGSRSERVVAVTTAWELLNACAAPRLVSAYIES